MLVALKNEGFEWKFIQGYKMSLRNLNLGVKLRMDVCEFEDTFVIDFRVVKGGTIGILEIVSKIYSLTTKLI